MNTMKKYMDSYLIMSTYAPPRMLREPRGRPRPIGDHVIKSSALKRTDAIPSSLATLGLICELCKHNNCEYCFDIKFVSYLKYLYKKNNKN